MLQTVILYANAINKHEISNPSQKTTQLHMLLGRPDLILSISSTATNDPSVIHLFQLKYNLLRI